MSYREPFPDAYRVAGETTDERAAVGVCHILSSLTVRILAATPPGTPLLDEEDDEESYRSRYRGD